MIEIWRIIPTSLSIGYQKVQYAAANKKVLAIWKLPYACYVVNQIKLT